MLLASAVLLAAMALEFGWLHWLQPFEHSCWMCLCVGKYIKVQTGDGKEGWVKKAMMKKSGSC